MREILFRGKRMDNKAWEDGSLVITRGGCYDQQVFISDKMTGYHTPVISETVCQFTGLYDKNGRKIFEGDIVVFADFFNDEIHRGVVYWCDLAFWFDCTETEGDEGIYSLAYISANILEVIGNIYDNPELLEVKQNEV